MQSPSCLGNNLRTKLARMGQPFYQGLNLPTHLHTHTKIKYQHQGLEGAFLPLKPCQVTRRMQQGVYHDVSCFHFFSSECIGWICIVHMLPRGAEAQVAWHPPDQHQYWPLHPLAYSRGLLRLQSEPASAGMPQRSNTGLINVPSATSIVIGWGRRWFWWSCSGRLQRHLVLCMPVQTVPWNL